MKFKHLLLMLMYFAFFFNCVSTLSIAEGIVVIVNKNIPPDSINAEKVKEIYSGRMVKWPNNQPIVLSAIEGTEIHKEFLNKYIKKTESQFSNTWKKMIFTGQGSYPKIFTNSQAVADFVSKTENAIGYVDVGTNTDHVNVVK